jgi:hypothetical protein
MLSATLERLTEALLTNSNCPAAAFLADFVCNFAPLGKDTRVGTSAGASRGREATVRTRMKAEASW